MKKWLIFSLFILLFVSGCQGTRDTNRTATYDLRTDRSAPQYMSNRFPARNVTNHYPNFLDVNQPGGGTQKGTNTGTDVDKAKQTVAETKKFIPGSVWINGDRMWVTAYKKGALSTIERRAAEALLHRKLAKVLPRYKIEVMVREDRR